MAEPDPGYEALRAALFEGELTADEARDLHAALVARRDMIRAACEHGTARPEDLAELQQIDQQLQILAEEEVVAEFVEEAFEATVRRQEMLDQAGEIEPE